MKVTFGHFAVGLAVHCLILLAGSAHDAGAQVGPAVASLALNPSTITGGSGDSAIATVTLGTPASTGGILVTLSSSNTDLAASVPSVTVPQGTTSATFTIGTNALYRRYSGLSFTVTISASANGSTRSATLIVTAQPQPADVTSDTSNRSGPRCGGAVYLSRGDPGILYDCKLPQNPIGNNGTCTFKEECALGCRTEPLDGFDFNDACATTSPFPIVLNPSYLVGGSSSAGAILLSAPAPAGSSAGASTNTVFATVTSVDPLPTGATSAGFTVSTTAVAVANFARISGGYTTPEPLPQGGTFFRQRLALSWLTSVPPPGEPPAALSTFTLNPTTVVAGEASQATITLTKVAPAGGADVKLGADVPAVVIPFSVTVPEGAISTTFPVCSVNGDASVSIAAAYGGVLQKVVLTTTAAPPFTISSITLDPSSVVGGNPSTATVTLTAPAPCSGIRFFLSSSSSAAAVPAIVTSPAGAISASFTVSTTPVAATTSATISLFDFGTVFKSPPLVITPPGGGSPIVTSLTLSPSSVVGGNSSTGTVTLNAAVPAGGAVVSLGSSHPAVATVPPSVTVAAGATSASFTVTTSSVAMLTSVSIFGSLGGATQTAQLLVAPPASLTLASLALSPTSVEGGNTSMGTVTLSAAAPSGGAVVPLSSSNTGAVTVPPSVTVPAGNTNATFTVTTVSVGVSTTATISASFGGVSKTALLTVTAPAPPPSVDTVAITRAEYVVSKQQLRVDATSTSSTATLTILVTANGQVIGILANNGAGGFSGQLNWPVNPENITAKSSVGGSATSGVVAK